MLWPVCVSSENYSDYVQEHSDRHNYHVQYHPTERLTDLHPLDPVTIEHHNYYLIKTEDPSRNMATAALLQETGGIGGENFMHANIIYGAKTFSPNVLL